MSQQYTIREARPDEYPAISQLMVAVYSTLENFPNPAEQPKYYAMLANVGVLIEKPTVKLLVASNNKDEISGAVVFIGDMTYYGSKGTAPQEKKACGFRLLAVSPSARGGGLGKLLSKACISLGQQEGHEQMIIHTTNAMKIAWGMYERLGFERAKDLDFMQDDFPVFGFRLGLLDKPQ